MIITIEGVGFEAKACAGGFGVYHGESKSGFFLSSKGMICAHDRAACFDSPEKGIDWAEEMGLVADDWDDHR